MRGRLRAPTPYWGGKEQGLCVKEESKNWACKEPQGVQTRPGLPSSHRQAGGQLAPYCCP